MAAKTYSSCRVTAFGQVARTKRTHTHGGQQHNHSAALLREVMQQKVKQEMFPKPVAPQREEMLTIQVKNTMLHMNDQNLRRAAKNGRNSKTPGLHLSAAHGKEAAGRLTACSPTQEGTAQLDSLLKSPRPDSERGAENQPVRRPLKLAPLELPEEVREAQRQKLKQEVKATSCKLDMVVNEPQARKVKSCARQRLAKVCPTASIEPLKVQNRSSRPQLTRSNPVEPTRDRHLEDVVCRGAPAPLCSKPAPPLVSPRVKTRAARGSEAARPNQASLQQETGRRRLRLRRAQCLEEDQCNSNTSTGGLSADKGKLAQGVQGKGQRAPRGLREANRKLGEASKSLPQPPGSLEASGRAIKRIAVSNLQDAL